MATTTGTLSLTLQIGSTSIPIETPIPPVAGSTSLTFSYTLPDTATAPVYVVSVGDFVTWAANIGFTGTLSNLPTSLQALSVGIKKIVIDTDKGQYDAAVIFGKMTNNVWDPSWKPVNDLPISFKNVSLEVDREP
jgi:hypothetical protein